MINSGYVDGMNSSAFGIIGGLYLGMFIFSSIIGLIAIISYAKIFSKAGKPWWACLVPIYNFIVMLEIAKLPMWYIALFFVPIANVYAIFKINIEMAKKFGKGTGFGIGMTLLSIIFIPLLAFSDNKYEDESLVSENVNNQFDANNVINNSVSTDSATVVAPIGNVEISPVENVTLENNPFSPIESAPIEPALVVEPIENIPVEPAPIVEPVVNIPVEPASVVEPMESVPVEPVEKASQVNAFNMQSETNIEPIAVETMNEPVIPEQLNVNSTEVDLTVNLAEDKKVCKNCGNELPDIVSICPNCGTDNE